MYFLEICLSLRKMLFGRLQIYKSRGPIKGPCFQQTKETIETIAPQFSTDTKNPHPQLCVRVTKGHSRSQNPFEPTYQCPLLSPEINKGVEVTPGQVTADKFSQAQFPSSHLSLTFSTHPSPRGCADSPCLSPLDPTVQPSWISQSHSFLPLLFGDVNGRTHT